MDDKGKTVVNLSSEVKELKQRIADLESLKNETEKYTKMLYDLIDGVPDLFILVDVSDWTIVFLNSAMAKSLGKTRKELIGINLTNFLPHNIAETRRKKAQDTILTGKPVTFEDKRNEKWFTTTLYPISDSDGKVKYIAASCRDDTARKKAEISLNESEEKFRMLSEQSLMGILIIQDNDLKYVNDAVARLTGYSKEEMFDVGVPLLTKVIHPDDLPVVMEQLRKKLIGDKDVISIYPFKIVTKTGKVRWAELFSKTILLGGRNADFIILIDITNRKMAEEEVIETKNRLQKVVDSASEIIFAMDNDFKILTWNKTLENLTGYSRRKILGKHLLKFDIFDNPKELLDLIKNSYGGHSVVPSSEIVLTTKTGEKRLIHPFISATKGERGEIVGVLVIGKDITQDSKVHGKLLFGNSYLIADSRHGSPSAIVESLTMDGSPCLYISRLSPTVLKNGFLSSHAKVMILGQEKVKGFENTPNLDDLVSKIEKFSRDTLNSTVLLDRVDYLITNFSFESFIKTLYKINDFISSSKTLFLLRINPDFLEKNQLALIEEEFNLPPNQKIKDIRLEETLYDILKFIFDRNELNELVSFSKISKHFSISKVTTAKRLSILVDYGLIYIRKTGKSKTVNVTDKGRSLLEKRERV